MNLPPPNFQLMSGELSSDLSGGIKLSSISTCPDSSDIIGEAGPGLGDTTSESTVILGLEEIRPRMKAHEVGDSTKDQILRHALEMLRNYEAENQLLREQQYYLLGLTEGTGVSVTNPLNDSSTTSQLSSPNGKSFRQKSELSINDIVSEPDLATIRETTNSSAAGSANSQGANREVSPIESTLQPKTSTVMPSKTPRVEESQGTDRHPPSVFHSMLSKISTIGRSAVEKASETLGVDTLPGFGALGASRPTATTANLSYHAVALGLKVSDPDAATKWKLLKTKTVDWLCLIQPEWETASGIRITTVMSLGNQIRNTPGLAGINTREVPLRRFIFYLRNMRRKSRARKMVN